MIGASQLTTTANTEGAAYVYLGAATGPGASPAWSMTGGQNRRHILRRHIRYIP